MTRKPPISNSELQRIYDSAKAMWGENHNPNYEPQLWNVLCVIRAYCQFTKQEEPEQENRDWMSSVIED
jgi:hypothetical protein